ncbi:BCCT family transporter [Thiohalorhabdus sp. Cl-TMA]|uniref:BCCT family transporter n=1 Tax=Thiohalorhabdus methylotrophus TaxID=3242694 RepID=A0ABV4TVT0_9GAMM
MEGGKRAARGPLKGMSPVVYLGAATLMVAMLLLGTLVSGETARLLADLREQINPFLAWYYVGLVAFILAFVLWLGVGRYKNVRLGGDLEQPEFTLIPWLAMLFAAGTGVGLLFWSVAEPILHLGDNPLVEAAGTPEAATAALRLTFFHWGLSAWSVFAVVALSLAYFAYRQGLPLTLRSALHPLLGHRIHGTAGHLVDIFAVLATVFGVATTLGFGAQQMETGLSELLGIERSQALQLAIIAAVTLAATASVASGVRRGVRRLSELNLWLAVLLLVLFLVLGPTWQLFGYLLQAGGDYFQNLISRSFWTGMDGHRDWHTEWTVFYWGWWIAWSPFVGMFIARISRGRTLREFVFGVLLLPAVFNFLWIAALGGTAIDLEMNDTVAIAGAVQQDVTVALYRTIEALTSVEALATGTAVLATLLIAIFFITSADSGTLVINTIMAYGDPSPPLRHRIAWGLGIGVLTAVLVVGGGTQTLQDAVIAAALPFSFIMLLMMAGVLKGLREERFAPREGIKHHLPEEPWTGVDTETATWRAHEEERL